MDRLTEKSPTGKNCIPLKRAAMGIDLPKWAIKETSFLENRLEGDAADRLAAYEDTGLTPEEVKTALRELERYRKLGTVEELNEAVYNASL
jgi:hypothetical protein